MISDGHLQRLRELASGKLLFLPLQSDSDMLLDVVKELEDVALLVRQRDEAQQEYEAFKQRHIERVNAMEAEALALEREVNGANSAREYAETQWQALTRDRAVLQQQLDFYMRAEGVSEGTPADIIHAAVYLADNPEAKLLLRHVIEQGKRAEQARAESTRLRTAVEQLRANWQGVREVSKANASSKFDSLYGCESYMRCIDDLLALLAAPAPTATDPALLPPADQD